MTSYLDPSNPNVSFRGLHALPRKRRKFLRSIARQQLSQKERRHAQTATSFACGMGVLGGMLLQRTTTLPTGAIIAIYALLAVAAVMWFRAHLRNQLRISIEMLTLALRLGDERRQCFNCGYARDGLSDDTPCPECARLPVPWDVVRADVLYDAKPRHKKRLLNTCRGRAIADAYSELTPIQRMRTLRTHCRAPSAKFNRILSVYAITFLCYTLGVIAFGALFIATSMRNEDPILLFAYAAFFSLFVPGALTFFYLKTNGFLRLLGRTRTNFIRALNHTLDHSCPVCDAHRTNIPESSCPTCGCPPIPEYAPQTPSQPPISP